VLSDPAPTGGEGAASSGPPSGTRSRRRRRGGGGFRAFRRSRPFWAGLFTILGGLEIFVLPLSPIASLVLLGVAGVSSIVTGILLMVLGAFMWFSPANRTLAGVLTIIFALTSFVTSNLGGLVVGMVLGIVGGALCLAWTDRPPDGGGRRRARTGSARPVRGSRADDPAGPLTGTFARRAGTVALVVAAALAGTVAPASAAPAQQCVLLIICPPDVPAPGPSPPAPRSTVPGTTPPPTSTGATPTTPPTGTPTNPGLLPGLPGLPLPAPTDPAVPGLVPDGLLPGGVLPDGLLPQDLLPPAGLLPDGLLTPVLPNVPPDPGLVVSGLIGDLTMDELTVTNFRFLGVVEHRTATGGTQRALRIVVDSTDITDLGVVLPGPTGTLLVTQTPGAPNASSGRLVLDVTRLSLRIFGILPVEFSFAFPPPPLITIPVLSGTDVDIDYVHINADLLGPSLDVRPGPATSGETGASPVEPTAASLVALASLLELPELLVPYGFTEEEADTAVRDGPPPEQVDADEPPEPATAGPEPPAPAVIDLLEGS
jgi:hypothetical protein